MYFFNQIFLAVFIGYYFSLTRGQTYQQLTEDELKKLCANNNVHLAELKTLHNNVQNLLTNSITPTENPTNETHCLGINLQHYLKREMHIVEKCINGTIKLDNSSIQAIINESERKLCALSKLASYEEYLGETCLNSTRSVECQSDAIENIKLENANEFSNLGLTYTENGRKNWLKMFDCAINEVNKSCDILAKLKHEQLSKKATDTINNRKKAFQQS